MKHKLCRNKKIAIIRWLTSWPYVWYRLHSKTKNFGKKLKTNLLEMCVVYNTDKHIKMLSRNVFKINKKISHTFIWFCNSKEWMKINHMCVQNSCVAKTQTKLTEKTTITSEYGLLEMFMANAFLQYQNFLKLWASNKITHRLEQFHVFLWFPFVSWMLLFY